MRNWVLFAQFAIYLCLTSCPSQAKTLKVRALGEPQNLDWNKASTWVEGFVIRNLMEGLLEIGPGLKPEPALAKSWKASADHKTYAFTLREGVKWSDGISLKAQDFVASWKRLLDPASNAKYASILFDLEGAEAFHRGELKDFGNVGVRAIGDLTLEVRLRASIPNWEWVPTFYATYPIRGDLKQPTSMTLGPYQVSAQEKGKRILLKKNMSFYGHTGNIDEIEFLVVPDDLSAIQLYEAGKIDFLAKIPSLERKRFKDRKDFHTWADLRLVHLRMNTRQGITAKAAIRRAIALSINRSKLAELYEGNYEPATAFVPPEILGYSKQAGLGFDPEKAKRELKTAGIEPSTLPPLNLLTVAFDDQIILAQFIQEQLKINLGLNVRIHTLEPKRYYSPAMRHDDYQMQINFWGADYPDPDNFFSVFLANSGLNRYEWRDSKYDALVTSARSEADRKAREKTYRAAQKILIEDQVVTIPLYYGKINGLVRDTIWRVGEKKGEFKPGPLNWWLFKELSM